MVVKSPDKLPSFGAPTDAPPGVDRDGVGALLLAPLVRSDGEPIAVVQLLHSAAATSGAGATRGAASAAERAAEAASRVPLAACGRVLEAAAPALSAALRRCRGDADAPPRRPAPLPSAISLQLRAAAHGGATAAPAVADAAAIAVAACSAPPSSAASLTS